MRINLSWQQAFDQSKASTDEYLHTARKQLTEMALAYTAADVIALARIMAYEFRTAAIVLAAQNVCDELELIGLREGV